MDISGKRVADYACRMPPRPKSTLPLLLDCTRTSPAFAAGGKYPVEFTGDGAGVSTIGWLFVALGLLLDLGVLGGGGRERRRRRRDRRDARAARARMA